MYAELSDAPPCALSSVSDFSYDIDSSSKNTSLLIKRYFLRIPKSKTLNSFGEPDEDTLLRLGLQFVPFLTINQTICRATEIL